MATEKEMKLAKNTFDTLCQWLRDEGWKFEADEEKLLVSFGAVGDDLSMNLTVKVNTDLMIVSVYNYLGFNIPENKRADMAIAICAANERLHDGNFDLNLLSGSMLFRMTCSFRESLLGKELMKYLVMTSCVTMDNFNDKFYDFVNDKISFKELVAWIKE